MQDMTKRITRPPRKTGRPSEYSDARGETICAAIVETGSLTAALRLPGMPGQSAVHTWLAVHPTFALMYARAREQATEAESEELRRISLDPDIPADHKRIQVDTLKWLMARRAPRKWGDRTIVAGDPEAPLVAIKIELVGD